MRSAQFFCHFSLIAASLPLLAGAEPLSSASSPPALLDPTAPTLPLAAESLAAGKTVVNADADWKAANAAVARFARGHADIVRWEKSQAADIPQPGKDPAMEHAHPQHPKGRP